MFKKRKNHSLIFSLELSRVNQHSYLHPQALCLLLPLVLPSLIWPAASFCFSSRQLASLWLLKHAMPCPVLERRGSTPQSHPVVPLTGQQFCLGVSRQQTGFAKAG